MAERHTHELESTSTSSTPITAIRPFESPPDDPLHTPRSSSRQQSVLLRESKGTERTTVTTNDTDTVEDTLRSRRGGNRYSGGSPRGYISSGVGGSPSRSGGRRKRTSIANGVSERSLLPRLSRSSENEERADRCQDASDLAERQQDRSIHYRHSDRRSNEGRLSKHRHLSNKRQANPLERLANHSELSVTSRLTHSSSGSNSTVPQKSHDKAHVLKLNRNRERRVSRASTERRPTQPQPSVDHMANSSNVFQYLHESAVSSKVDMADIPSSRSSSVDSDEETDDGNPEISVTSQGSISPPMPTIADEDVDVYMDKERYDSGISIQGSSPEQQHYPKVFAKHSNDGHHRHGEFDADEDEDEDDEDDDEDEESDEDEDNDGVAQHSQALQKFLFHTVNDNEQPREPQDEQLRQELKNKEDELRQHVIQNPQPQRSDFRFRGAPSPTLPTGSPYYAPAAPYGVPPEMMYPPPPMIAYPPAPPASGPVIPQYGQHMAQPQPSPGYGYYPTHFDSTRVTILGYEKLANKLLEYPDSQADTKQEVKPLYRKFEALNHRVLLHLQDEISELEEELRYMDESIAQLTPTGNNACLQLPSRRNDARFGGDLHYQRTELLGRIYIKLGQYNQGLSSFRTVNGIDKASSEEIDNYRKFVGEHATIDKTELQFLDKAPDLVSISSPTKAAQVVDDEKHSTAEIISRFLADHNIHPAAAAFGFAALLTLLVFALLPGFAIRLVLLIIIGAAEAAVVASTELVDTLPSNDWVTWGAVYFGFMAILAALVG